MLLPLLTFVPLVLKLYVPFGEIGMDLFIKLKQQFMTPSNSNIFLTPETKSMFSCISDTNKVCISNLCSHMSTIIGIMNKTLTHCPFAT